MSSMFLLTTADTELLSAKDHPSLWVHIDAAWAGVALCCPEYREMCYLEEINDFADSFCTNFHKVRTINLPSILRN